MDKSIDNSLNDEYFDVSNFGDEELGVFWGKVTEKEESFAHQIDSNDNKSVTNSCHHLYDLQEVDEEEDNSMANESMALSQNTSINDKMNETFTIGDKTIGAEVTIDCEEVTIDSEKVTIDSEEVLNEKPVWSDVNISFNKTCDQTIDKSCVDLNICHNQNEIHSYCNVINHSNNDPIIDKSIERLIDESVVVSDPFSPTFLNTFKTNENIDKRSSSLGLINTESLLINSSPDIIVEEIITDLDNKLIIDDFEPNFEPNVSLIPKSTTPSITNELIDDSMDCIEVNALDLLSPFAGNKLTHVSQSKTEEEVPITCSLVDITLPQKFASLKKKNIFNTSINSDVITPQKKDFSVNDSTIDFILNEIACNSAQDIDECNENEQTIIESQPKDITSLQVIDECEQQIDNRFDNKETEEISEKLEQNNEIMEEINEKLDENMKYGENETPKSIKTEVNMTLRSSKKKVTFARSPLSHISRNIEPLIISSVEKSVQIIDNKNNSVHKMSGIKPPLKIRQTPDEKLSSGKKIIDFNDKQTWIKSSGIKPPQKTSRTPNNANNMTPNKKKMHFDNIVSPVAKYINQNPTPPIQRTIRPKTISATNCKFGLPQPGFLSRINNSKTAKDSNEKTIKASKPSQLPTLVYKSKSTPKLLTKPSKETKSVIPMIINHIGGTPSIKKTQYLDSSEINDITESTSFWETHSVKQTSFLKH